jgi:RNAse (barnase) inhibitor barstar
MMVSLEHLDTAAPPWLLLLETTPAHAYEFAWRAAAAGPGVRVLRGRKMRTEANLYDEFGAALQFPDYFGENWDALNECITDLSWVPAQRYVLVLVDAVAVLADTPPRSLEVLTRILEHAGEEWARPISVGEAWDRPAVPFHVVLQATAEERAAMVEWWKVPLEPLG